MFARMVERLIDRQVRKYAKIDQAPAEPTEEAHDTIFVRKSDYQRDKREIMERLLRVEGRVDAIAAEVTMTERTIDVP